MTAKFYAVGGAVRDRLLGLPVKDRDWVVVGATPDDMLAMGFRPVGKDFPVFLHPRTHEEYALARTERKTAPGYHGFVFHTDPSVTLEEDLARRDLTINAMAEDQDGTIIDPYGGQDDLSRRLLRHVGAAFAEDPVRILRLARFAARFDFTVADETAELMRDMVRSGEVDALVAERVWQEMSRALMESRPSRFFRILDGIGALARVAPELAASLGDPDDDAHPLRRLDAAAAENPALEIRFALLAHRLPQPGLDALCARLRVPGECRDLAHLLIARQREIAGADGLAPDAMLALFKATDALRRPERFGALLSACALAAPGGLAGPVARLNTSLAAARGIDAGAVARATQPAALIPARVDAARVAAMAASLDRQ
ncbi:multifunctional CCA tRNA nucleotidyl transferase/2'3'-cyclic phosphodiesterase/2'nucleotidase/phosphatase [Paludibacterium paludis]|uniref:CCA-adding enzyme n=1 Tax=Paludibacterium paludis TaxID=1225769 RepID=A0A918UBI8_9NEIS|nr:multifunctional CCA tRNA nucleotidyl transferase/2'3'-cyclic phosphodiesterase/2'nucleotidase/phosphatase [Paludibacterium paludis]GGY25476.1 multifunctional CCA protein [Paludibacterium paludis]